jgi:hypothetical protein
MSNETLLEEKPNWRWWGKVLTAGAVAAATTVRSAGGMPLWVTALCDGVIAIGVIVGIGSAGLSRGR